MHKQSCIAQIAHCACMYFFQWHLCVFGAVQRITTLQFHKQNQMSHEYLLVVNLKLTLAALSSTSTLTLGSQIKAPRYKSTSIGGLM